MEDDESKCGCCGKADALPFHSCPYQSDVKNNSEFECDCCERCTQNCRDDI